MKASNPNGGVLNFALASGPVGMSVDSTGGAVNWIASFTAQRVKITVTDGQGGKVVHGYLARVFTNLSSGPLRDSSAGPKTRRVTAWIDVPAKCPFCK